ncbi:uncharacterized protein FIBRA_03420 [Fibroporia radiculosa]|uniref:Cytochrome P450 n=1 Tax=Fibroporia radiculosa TaxID=599839 RepID=J4GNG9_9APHY|nr:uncharacterized protein FIBRA_03420 [Fibroporia radiculosa]CCM01370.1 predicted protein [Fibroporia radiculosa]
MAMNDLSDIIRVIIPLLVLSVVYTRWARSKARLPPGPTPLPLLGNVHQIPWEYQHKSFADWGKKYGPVVFARIFNMPIVILSSIQTIEDLLDKRGAIYSDRPIGSMYNDMVEFTANTAFLPYNDQWRRHRKWLQAAIATPKAIESLCPLQQRESLRLLVDLVNSPEEFMLHIKRYPAALMMEIAYGRHVSSMSEDKLVGLTDQALEELVKLGGFGSTVVDFIPLLRHIPVWFPGAAFKRRALKIRDMIHTSMNTPYNKVREEMLAGSARPSYLRMLLETYPRDKTPSREEEADMKGSATSMYGAGAETTTSTLQSFLLAMILHPKVFQKAQAEIDRVIESSRLPDFEDRDSLPYLECVLKEVYRWNTPVPLSIPHRLMEDDVYNGFHIPKGSTIIPNVWAIAMDPDMYLDPELFWPERFEGMDEEEADLKDPRRVVFGSGRRICPGRQLGERSIWLAVARITATFDIKKARDASGVEITPEASFPPGSVSHPKPFVCDIRPRSEKAAMLVDQLNKKLS